MFRINRRTLLVGSTSALFASTAVETAIAGIPQLRRQGPSRQLQKLIETHKKTYAAFGEAINGRGSHNGDHAKASRAEEKALLAVCSYPAVSEDDRRAKANYLLKTEARGELDLREHMQAVLRSMM